MTVELKGTVHAVMVEQEITDNYKKKEIVIMVDENSNYPQPIICHASNQKIDLLNGINMGDKVTAHCNLNGKNSNGKYFNNLQIWKIEKN